MEPRAYQAWLSGGAPKARSAVGRREAVRRDLACNTCHRPDAQGRGPVLDGLFGTQVTLQDGEKVTATRTTCASRS
jgi:mono/diheme cytochrome c family protein